MKGKIARKLFVKNVTMLCIYTFIFQKCMQTNQLIENYILPFLCVCVLCVCLWGMPMSIAQSYALLYVNEKRVRLKGIVGLCILQHKEFVLFFHSIFFFCNFHQLEIFLCHFNWFLVLYLFVCRFVTTPPSSRLQIALL